MLKTTYAFGLRAAEAARLEVHDFGRNPKATEFGDFGVCNVRFGKAMPGSPPKRARGVDGDAVVGRGDRAVGGRGVAVVPA
jgi:hypothetical protein